MQECLTSKKGATLQRKLCEHTASPLFKNSITNKRKMNTKFTVANNKTMSYKLQHNLTPK